MFCSLAATRMASSWGRKQQFLRKKKLINNDIFADTGEDTIIQKSPWALSLAQAGNLLLLLLFLLLLLVVVVVVVFKVLVPLVDKRVRVSTRLW